VYVVVSEDSRDVAIVIIAGQEIPNGFRLGGLRNREGKKQG